MNVKWTEEEKDYIRENAQFMKDKELARNLSDKSGRTISVDALRKVRQKLGIIKKPGRGVCGVVWRQGQTSKTPLASRSTPENGKGPLGDPPRIF